MEYGPPHQVLPSKTDEVDFTARILSKNMEASLGSSGIFSLAAKRWSHLAMWSDNKASLQEVWAHMLVKPSMPSAMVSIP